MIRKEDILARLTPDLVQRIYSDLVGVQALTRAGAGWKTNVPWREDKHPSLTISPEGVWCDQGRDGEGGSIFDAYMRVHGCEFITALNAIAEYMGLDDTSIPPGTGAPEQTVYYVFTDESGNPTTREVKSPGKRFHQERIDEHGRWVKGTQGAPRLPYNLQALHGAPRHRHAFIVEGPKDVDAITALGLLGTTNAGGAGNWHSDLNEHFRGRPVVILRDNDPAGHGHGLKVAQSLYGIASSIKIVDLPGLPPKGDVSDWIAAGGTKGQLQEIVLGTPEWSPETSPSDIGATGLRVIRAIDVQPTKTLWLWEDRLPAGKFAIFDGDPGQGKTTIVIDIIARLTVGAEMPCGTGSDFIGPQHCLIITFEDDIAATLVPRLMAAGADLSRVHIILGTYDPASDDPGMVRIPEDVDKIRDLQRQTGAVLLMIDPLVASLAGDTNANRDQDVRRALAPLVRLGEETGMTVLGIRHLNKSGGTNSIHRGGGSIGIIGAARIGWMVRANPQDDDGIERVFAVTKSNLAPVPTSLRYTTTQIEVADGITSSRIHWIGAIDMTADDLLEVVDNDAKSDLRECTEIIQQMLADGPMKHEDLMRKLRPFNFGPKTIRNARRDAQVISTRKGYGSDGYNELSLKYPKPPMLARDSHAGPSNTGGKHGASMGEHDEQLSPAVVTPLPLMSCAACGTDLLTNSSRETGLCGDCRRKGVAA